MKKVLIVARERIFKNAGPEVHDDFGLRALNGYYEESLEVDDSLRNPEIVQQFIERNPQCANWSIEIKA